MYTHFDDDGNESNVDVNVTHNATLGTYTQTKALKVQLVTCWALTYNLRNKACKTTAMLVWKQRKIK